MYQSTIYVRLVVPAEYFLIKLEIEHAQIIHVFHTLLAYRKIRRK